MIRLLFLTIATVVLIKLVIHSELPSHKQASEVVISYV